jgi:tetratricopeptide (TPR) repeat protein
VSRGPIHDPDSARAPGALGPPRPPGSTLEEPPRVDREGSVVALRLAIGKDGVGLELARKATLECVDVVELVVRLPHVKFPFDVTGGVAKFRNKRGELERLALEIDGRRAARWAEPRLRGLVSVGPASVSVVPRRFGASVTVTARSSVADALESTRVPALAFEVGFLPSEADLIVVVHGARGVNLLAPATALAMRAVAALLGDAARREGSRFVVSRAAARLGRRLLPDAGVRAPGGDDVLVVGSGESDGVLFVQLVRGGAIADVPDEVTRAHETALLAREGDDARFRGDYDEARRLDLVALERAPRHPELAKRIAEIDAHAGGRPEAATTTLREAAHEADLGSLLGDLLAEAGDTNGAIAALLRAAERDRSSAVAALLFARAATFAQSPHDALAWLDGAVARAPRIAELRWERARRRLAAGRLADARADYQELETLAQGPRERHQTLRRAADDHRAAGLGAQATTLYERALLYRPDDPVALAGLGAALASEDRAARGAALLAHAIETAASRYLQTAWMELELGRVLGERLGDMPAAVARLRAIPDEAPEAIAARGLEGRFRARIGDTSGASLAFARLRERAGRERAAVPWLVEAASFESNRGDLEAAQQHAAAALAILPQSPDLLTLHRELGERIAEKMGIRRDVGAPAPAVAAPAPAVTAPAPAPSPVLAEPAPAHEAHADDEARVEILTQRLHGDPTNDAVVDELVGLLTRLGRSMELLALLSARLEDAPLERRDELLPRHREVLAKLEADARAEGREVEADLFKMAREAS